MAPRAALHDCREKQRALPGTEERGVNQLTLPDERYRSIQNTREFLRSLLNPKETPRVPRAIRRQAYYLLKHYPWDIHMDMAAAALPDTFAQPVYGRIVSTKKGKR
jgi:hypothetical protein